MDPAASGRIIAKRYRLSEIIGRGGMGVVWRARDELLNRDVAVKELIWPAYLTEPEQEKACRRAVREAQMAARLTHRNVIRIYDIVEEDTHPWIVMELLPHRSLLDLVLEEGPVSPARAAQVGLGILAALRAAHAAGIVHRDVKPANILIGPDDRVVLTDFGIARAVGPSTLTTAGVLIGSPSYLAPERARGAGSDPPADLWGLGASLYTAVEGRPPFERDDALASLAAVVTEEPEPAHNAGPLAPVISGLLRKDPDERLDAAETERMLRQVEQATAPSHVGRATPPAALPAMALDDGPAGPAGPASPVSPVVPVSPGPRRSRRPRAALAGLAWPAVLAAGAAGAIVAALALTSSPRHQTGTATAGSQPDASATSHPNAPALPPSGRAASAGTSRSPATPSSPAIASPGSANAGSGSAGSPGNAGAGAVPAGYYRFTNPTGFSIGVPAGWQISHVGHYVYIVDPANSGVFLLIDQSDQPKPDPLADWEQQQAARESSYPDYHLIRMQSVDYPQAEKAADWEFTYDRNGVTVHILNRNVLANAHHAYALYWSAPESGWTADYHYFRAFATTFRPAPP
jgi:tRNA A-37 threonylcarbamoyl transferase component Bud32